MLAFHGQHAFALAPQWLIGSVASSAGGHDGKETSDTVGADAIAVGGQTSEASSLIRLRDPTSLRGRDPRVVGVFGVADLACDRPGIH